MPILFGRLLAQPSSVGERGLLRCAVDAKVMLLAVHVQRRHPFAEPIAKHAFVARCVRVRNEHKPLCLHLSGNLRSRWWWACLLSNLALEACLPVFAKMACDRQRRLLLGRKICKTYLRSSLMWLNHGFPWFSSITRLEAHTIEPAGSIGRWHQLEPFRSGGLLSRRGGGLQRLGRGYRRAPVPRSPGARAPRQRVHRSPEVLHRLTRVLVEEWVRSTR